LAAAKNPAGYPAKDPVSTTAAIPARRKEERMGKTPNGKKYIIRAEDTALRQLRSMP
jgi:hypothetical protein